MGSNRFLYDLANDDHVEDLANSIHWHLGTLISQVPPDLDAEAIRHAIESHVSDLVKEDPDP